MLQSEWVMYPFLSVATNTNALCEQAISGMPIYTGAEVSGLTVHTHFSVIISLESCFLIA